MANKGDNQEGGIPPLHVRSQDEFLLPQHKALLEASAITPQVIAARGYRSEEVKANLGKLMFSRSQWLTPSLVIPIYGVNGNVVLHQIRPDTPRIGKRGKLVKYETPYKARMALDVPPLARQNIGNPHVPLYVTEGVRKADAAVSKGLCCIALLGVWNWRGTNDDGGKTALADWEHIALEGRQIYLAFDSDAGSNPDVRGC